MWRGVHAIHHIAPVSLEPWVLVLSFTTCRWGIQISVLASIYMLIGRQVDSGKLRVVETQATNREQSHAYFQTQHQKDPRNAAVLFAIPVRPDDEYP